MILKFGSFPPFGSPLFRVLYDDSSLDTSFPWSVAGIPLSTSTHLFHRIDPKVPLSWLHSPYRWVPWTTWQESLLPLTMVVSHVLNFKYIISLLRFVQGLVHVVFGQRPQMSPDSSTLMSLFEDLNSYVPCDFWVAFEIVFRSHTSASI